MSELGHFLELPSPFAYDYRFSIQTLRFSLALNSIELSGVGRFFETSSHVGVAELIHAACNHDIEWICRPISNPLLADLSRNLKLQNIKFLPGRACDEFRDPVDFISMKCGWGSLHSDARTKHAELARQLRPGGLLLVSYPALPGQAGMAALHHLVQTLSVGQTCEAMNDIGRLRSAVERALEFLDLNPAINVMAWGERSVIEEALTRLPEGLGGEVVASWSPQYFRDVARTMAAAGLEWACRAAPIDQVDALDLSPRHKEQLGKVDDRIAREELRTFLTHPRVRSDIWMRPGFGRGRRRELLDELKLVLVGPASEFVYEASGGALGTVALSRAAYGRLMKCLERHSGISLGTLAAELSTSLDHDQVCECLAVLHGLQLVQIVNPDEGAISRSISAARKLNESLAEAACTEGRIEVLGSPLTGAGIPVPWLHLVFLAALHAGEQQAAGWTRFGQAVIKKRGLPGWKPGAVQEEATRFERSFLPVYRRLLIAD